MRKTLLLIFFYAVFNVIGALNNITNHTYLPVWEDLDSRPLPQWYDSAKIGIFIHWGVYSVPSFGSEWFWYNWRTGDKKVANFVKRNYGAGFKYKDFAPMFNADKFDPELWAELFSKSGARYVVLTTKHHDGFTLFPSERPEWNSVDVGPKRDIVRILSEAITTFGMKFGVYYSLMEWYNDLLIEDMKENTTEYTDTIIWPDIKLLVNNYKPFVLWSDGQWNASDTYWKSPKLLAWLYNESPVKDEIVVNDRWGIDTPGIHGDFYNYGDAFNPGILMPHKWENAFPLDTLSWGYRRDMQPDDVLSFKKLLQTIVSTVSCGGNALINVGPTKEGIIVPIFQERLLQLGNWLNINGEAIYDTLPWRYQRDSVNRNVWYTCTKGKHLQGGANNETIQTIKAVYAIFLKWPLYNQLKLRDMISHLRNADFQIQLMNPNTTNFIPVDYQISNDMLEVHLPSLNRSMHGWVLKIVEVENE